MIRVLLGIAAGVAMMGSAFCHGQDRIELLLLTCAIILLEINENISERFGS